MQPRQASRLLRTQPLLVEEKLDGFNVSIARDEADWPVAYSRSGKARNDRGDQLGRIRAFIGQQSSALDSVLATWPVLYAEWLMREHSVYYDALPSWLIVLDLWSPTAGFAGVEVRDRCCEAAGLFTPPLLYRGVVGEVAHLETLTRTSRFATGPAEGVVLRDAVNPAKPPLAKWLAPHFRRKSNEELRRAGNNRQRAS
jgi:hypothetical protein